MELEDDTDAIVFHALRVYRNAVLDHCRQRLSPVFADTLDEEIQTLFVKEWEEISRSATLAYEGRYVDRLPTDALDYLSVNHLSQIFEKYWAHVSPQTDDGSSATSTRGRIVALARELNGVRNPIAHPPTQPLSLRDALRYIDSAVRLLDLLGRAEADDLRREWNAVLTGRSSDEVAPPSIVDTLPSREVITTDFIGRSDELADLWRWLGEDTRRIWALVGDGGKGKTTIAFEFAAQARSLLSEFGLQGVLWLTAKQRRFLDGEMVPTSSTDFVDLDTALDWILDALGWPEDRALETEDKLHRAKELLTEFPMLIVADDIDSLLKENEQAVEFFAIHVPQTQSKTLLTSRREVFGLGGCTTNVAGMTEDEVAEFIRRRAPQVGIDPSSVTRSTIRQIQSATDGSPLYIEDLLRLSHFYSLEHALNEWSGRRGDPAREYALGRELEKLSRDAVEILGVLAFSDSPISLQECALISGLSDERAEPAMAELRSWNLLVKPGLVEDVPRYGCSRNLSKLMRRTLEGTDQAVRISNGLKGLRGVAFGSARVRQYIQQAVALKQTGDQADAERTLKRGLEEIPNAGELHAMLGWLYSRWAPTTRYVDAVENFERAEALGSWGREMFAHWASMELKRDEFRRAIDVCERALTTAGKHDPYTWRLAGIAYTRLGRGHQQSLLQDQATTAFENADRALRKAQSLSDQPGDISRVFNSRYQLARTMGDQRRASAIIAEWEAALPVDPYRPS